MTDWSPSHALRIAHCLALVLPITTNSSHYGNGVALLLCVGQRKQGSNEALTEVVSSMAPDLHHIQLVLLVGVDAPLRRMERSLRVRSNLAALYLSFLLVSQEVAAMMSVPGDCLSLQNFSFLVSILCFYQLLSIPRLDSIIGSHSYYSHTLSSGGLYPVHHGCVHTPQTFTASNHAGSAHYRLSCLRALRHLGQMFG